MRKKPGRRVSLAGGMVRKGLGSSWELEDTSVMGALGKERVGLDEVWKVPGQTLKNPAAMPRDQPQFEIDV